jgi:hypothetical protein
MYGGVEFWRRMDDHFLHFNVFCREFRLIEMRCVLAMNFQCLVEFMLLSRGYIWVSTFYVSGC